MEDFEMKINYKLIITAVIFTVILLFMNYLKENKMDDILIEKGLEVEKLLAEKDLEVENKLKELEEIVRNLPVQEGGCWLWILDSDGMGFGDVVEHCLSTKINCYAGFHNLDCEWLGTNESIVQGCQCIV